ncbi:MAG: oligosaccharide flippase family protein [Bacteroidales bacterium]
MNQAKMKLNKIIGKSELTKNIITLTTGTVLAQLIPILMQPVLKRIFTPEDFGVFDIYLKFLGIICVVYSLKYEIGIVIPKKKVIAIYLTIVAVVSSLVFTAVFLILAILFGDDIAEFIGIGKNKLFIMYILPVSALFYSLFNTFNYFLIREKKFRQSSLNKISRRGAEGIVQVFFTFLGQFKSYGLIIGDFVGNFVYAVSAYLQNFKWQKIDARIFNKQAIRKYFIEYQQIPKYNVIPELLNSIFGATLTFLIISKFSIRETGFMELAQRMLIIPSAFISVSIGQVLLQRITELVHQKKSILGECKKTVSVLLVIGVAFFLVIFFFSPFIYTILFGAEWIKSAYYSQILILYFTVSFIFSPFGQVLIALKKFKINALWQIGKLLVISVLFLKNSGSIQEYLHLYNIISTSTYIIYGIIIFMAIKNYEEQRIKTNL